MKALITLIAALVAVMPMSAQDKGVAVTKTDGETLHIANASLRDMTFVGDDAVFTSLEGDALAIPRALIADIRPVSAVATQYAVAFQGDKASVVNPYALQGVTTVIDGAYVTTVNPLVGDELTFSLSGATADGAYTYEGSYKCTLRLDGVDIVSQRGPAKYDVQTRLWLHLRH